MRAANNIPDIFIRGSNIHPDKRYRKQQYLFPAPPIIAKSAPNSIPQNGSIHSA